MILGVVLTLSFIKIKKYLHECAIFRSSPSKLDFSPVKSPELNFASLSGDKLTVAQVQI